MSEHSRHTVSGTTPARINSAKAQWLLIKRRDEGADARRNPQSTQPESVLSGRTIEEVSSGSRGGGGR